MSRGGLQQKSGDHGSLSECLYREADPISGIQFLRDATTRLSNVTVEVYEKNDDLGGTWYENRYPG
ncbi:hypothetical protein E4U53_005162, partial [Claviceps sorghi]